AQLETAACGTAGDTYTGVIYEAKSPQIITAVQRTRLHEHVAIASGLYGLVRPLDAIAPYRLSAGSRITGLPPLQSLWSKPIAGILEDSQGPILDMRSQAYVSLAPIPRVCAPRTVAVRVLQEHDGKRTVVSHFNKAAKGSLVGALIRNGPLASSIPALMQQLSALGYEWEADEQPNSSVRLDIITHYTPGKVSTPRR
ncbi:MAG: peroxide stress protein YaaA, partial [Actinomycetota bacterium]|nr:peroxide stress protein YaaA [Actinomycetota bacterium]